MTEFVIYTIVIALVLAGVGYWLQYGTQAEIAQRLRATGWPKTTGSVTDSQVEETKRSSILVDMLSPLRARSQKFYKPVIYYTYRVNGMAYQSSRYRSGLLSRAGEWMSPDRQKVEKIIAEYPHGKVVTVTYNLDDPTLAYLDINSAVGTQRVQRVSGLVLIAIAACLLVAGAYRVSQMVVTQSAVTSAPAAIPRNTEDVKSDLTHDLAMTCKAGNFAGQSMAYTRWECEERSEGALLYSSIFSRKLAPEKIDAVRSLTSGIDQQKGLEFFARVSQMCVPSANSQEVKDWFGKTLPGLTEIGSEAETMIGGVRFALANPNGVGLRLEIGAIK